MEKVDELKRHPLILYGAGITASHWYNLLSKQNISVAEVVVDEKYYSEEVYFMGKKVKIFREISQEYNIFNVFVAFFVNDASRINRALGNTKGVSKVYHFDDPPAFAGEMCLYTYSYIVSNLGYYNQLYTQLYDELSRKIMCGFINQRISQRFGFLDELWSDNAYNPEDIFEYSHSEVFVDCGAFNGDTIKSLIKNIKGGGKLYLCF